MKSGYQISLHNLCKTTWWITRGIYVNGIGI